MLYITTFESLTLKAQKNGVKYDRSDAFSIVCYLQLRRINRRLCTEQAQYEGNPALCENKGLYHLRVVTS